jgi:hypothetical protein
MPDYTSRLALAKPRGGSSGSTPAEPVDIDVLNANADTIDAYIGAPACTSTARPVGKFDGQLAYETDTQNLIRYFSTTSNWAVIGGVVSFTQTYTGTIGWFQTYAFYSKIGNVVTVWGKLTSSSSGTPVINDLQLTLPIAARSTGNYGGGLDPLGTVVWVDSSAGTAGRYLGFAGLLTNTTVRIGQVSGSSSQLTAGCPFTVGNLDSVAWQFSYIATN